MVIIIKTATRYGYGTKMRQKPGRKDKISEVSSFLANNFTFILSEKINENLIMHHICIGFKDETEVIERYKDSLSKAVSYTIKRASSKVFAINTGLTTEEIQKEVENG